MKVHILGKGPISLRLASSLSLKFDVALYSDSALHKIRNSSIRTYEEFKIPFVQENDVVLVAWRKLPVDSSLKMQLLESLADKLTKTNLIINLSSVAVYGENNSIVDESKPVLPINNYGSQKSDLENYLNSNFASRILQLRISNVFGDFLFEDIVNKLVQTTKLGKPLELSEPSLHYRDFISIDTLVVLIEKMIDRRDFLIGINVFNVSSGQSLSILKLTQLVQEIFQIQIDYRIISTDTSIIKKSFVINAKINNFLGIDLEDELRLLEKYLIYLA